MGSGKGVGVGTTLFIAVALVGSSALGFAPISVAAAAGPANQQGAILASLTSALPSMKDMSPVSVSPPGFPCIPPYPAYNSSTPVEPSAANESISGHVVPAIIEGKARSLGALNSSRVISIEVVFAIRNPAQFQACLDSINDPRSANYGHFLTAYWLAPYLPTPDQKASVVSYLAWHGFNVTEGPPPLVVTITGTVAAAQKVFGVNISLYRQASGPEFYATNTDPLLPQNFAGMITRIGLDNYTVAAPQESPCGVSAPDCPQGIQVGYSFTGLYSGGYNGTGENVAVVDMPGDPNPQLAIDTFDAQYGLPPTTLTVLFPDGVPGSYSPGWASEAAMDIEAVHTTAPGAHIILLYDVGDPINSVDYVATNHLATIVSNSWTYICPSGHCPDVSLPASLLTSVDSRLAIDASQGLTILFASGDSGANPGGVSGTEFPPSDPNVLAVGATNLNLAGCTGTTCSGYGSETGASISGGGYSGHFAEPAWQTSALGSLSGRGVPDVSMLGFMPGIWVYSTLSDECGHGGAAAGWFGCSGTSLSTPLWAGFLAVALQIRGGGSFGSIDPLIYGLGSGASYASIFHDVTSGSNGRSAGPGWDPVTGWGTPITSALGVSIGGALVTEKVTITSANSGPSTLISISGCSASVSSVTADGTQQSFTATPACRLTFSVPADGAGSRYRFANSSTTWSITTGSIGKDVVAATVYSEMLVSVSYKVVGGGTPTAPKFLFSSAGSANSSALGLTSKNLWADYGAYSATNPLGGSTSTKRWATGSSPGVISGPGPLVLKYYLQYLRIFKFAVSHGGVGYSAPVVNYMQFGGGASVTAQTAGVWADASSWFRYPSTLPGSTTAERWYAGLTTGSVSGSGTVTKTYKHQFFVAFVASGPGTVKRASGWYLAGTTIGIRAVPLTGHRFAGWTTNTLLLVLSSPSTATAYLTVYGAGTVTGNFA